MNQEQRDKIVLLVFSIHFKRDIVKYRANGPGSSVVDIEYADGTSQQYLEDKAEREIWRKLGEVFGLLHRSKNQTTPRKSGAVTSSNNFGDSIDITNDSGDY
jgi:hypothetical protein